MKKIIIIFCIFISITSCGVNTTAGGGPNTESGGVYDIQYLYDSTSDTVKRGAELTITYKVKEDDSSIIEWINDLTIDNNTIDFASSVTDEEKESYSKEFLTEVQKMVEFGFDVSEDLAEQYIGEYTKWTVENTTGGGIYAASYLSWEFDGINAELKVIVPENAKSGYTRLRPYHYGCQSWSEYALIVVDESGDEIW